MVHTFLTTKQRKKSCEAAVVHSFSPSSQSGISMDQPASPPKVSGAPPRCSAESRLRHLPAGLEWNAALASGRVEGTLAYILTTI